MAVGIFIDAHCTPTSRIALIIKKADDKKEDTLKEDIIHYSISLKLVMNLYI